jgi:hypothetical protein
MPATDKKNLALAFLLCTTLGTGAMLVHTRQQLADARKAPSLQVTRSEFQAPAAPAAPATASSTATPPKDEPTESPATPPENAAPGGNGAARGARFATRMAELMKDPDFAEAWKIQQAARIDERYGALFKQLNLAPDKLAALKALLVERENAGREVFASAAASGLDPRKQENREQLRKLSEDLRNEVNANIKATVGDTTYAALDAYQATGPQRNAVKDFAETLSYSGAPLSSAQSEQLTKILTETGKKSGRDVLVTEATITRATGVLSSTQVEALKQLQTEQQAQIVVEEKMRALREEAAGFGGGGGGNRGNWGGGGGGNRGERGGN